MHLSGLNKHQVGGDFRLVSEDGTLEECQVIERLISNFPVLKLCCPLCSLGVSLVVSPVGVGGNSVNCGVVSGERTLEECQVIERLISNYQVLKLCCPLCSLGVSLVIRPVGVGGECGNFGMVSVSKDRTLEECQGMERLISNCKVLKLCCPLCSLGVSLVISPVGVGGECGNYGMVSVSEGRTLDECQVMERLISNCKVFKLCCPLCSLGVSLVVSPVEMGGDCVNCGVLSGDRTREEWQVMER